MGQSKDLEEDAESLAGSVVWLSEFDPPTQILTHLRARGLALTRLGESTLLPPSRLAFIAQGVTGSGRANLAGRRVAILHPDPGYADRQAQTLRSKGGEVIVLALNPALLDSVETFDPDAVLVEPVDFYASCWEMVRAIWSHPRLRWSPVLLAAPEPLGLGLGSGPNTAVICGTIHALSANADAIARRVRRREAFEIGLHELGPARTLRALSEPSMSVRARFETDRCTVEVDIAERIIVGARGGATRVIDDTFLGPHALAQLLTEAQGRVLVQPVESPAVTNLMAPLDAALYSARTSLAAPAPLSYAAPVALYSARSVLSATAPSATGVSATTAATTVSATASAAAVSAAAVLVEQPYEDAVEEVAEPATASRFARDPAEFAQQGTAIRLSLATETPRPGVVMPFPPLPSTAARRSNVSVNKPANRTVLGMPVVAKPNEPALPAPKLDARPKQEAALPVVKPSVLAETAHPAQLPPVTPSALANADTIRLPPELMRAPERPAPSDPGASSPFHHEEEVDASSFVRTLPGLARLASSRRNQLVAGAGALTVAALLTVWLWPSEPDAREVHGATAGAVTAAPAPKPEAASQAALAASPASANSTGTAAPSAAASPSQGATAAASDGLDEEDVDEELDDDRAASARKASELVSQGHSFRKKGLLGAAHTRYLQALEAHRGYPRAYAGLAQVALARRDGAEAVRFAKKLVSVRPQVAAYHLMLGDAYKLNGNLSAAKNEWSIAAKRGSKVARTRLK